MVIIWSDIPLGVFLKNYVLESEKIVFEKQKWYARVKSNREVLDYHFFCLCFHMCIHKSTLMSNFKAKKSYIKSRAPF